jgi:hypothetical protein
MPEDELEPTDTRLFLAKYFASSMGYVMTLFQREIYVASNEVNGCLCIVELRIIGE